MFRVPDAVSKTWFAGGTQVNEPKVQRPWEWVLCGAGDLFVCVVLGQNLRPAGEPSVTGCRSHLSPGLGSFENHKDAPGLY